MLPPAPLIHNLAIRPGPAKEIIGPCRPYRPGRYCWPNEKTDSENLERRFDRIALVGDSKL
jgi:hypothetical protein